MMNHRTPNGGRESGSAPRARVERRTAIVGYTLAVLLILGLAYAFALQVGYRQEFARVAQRQQREITIPLPSRGRILDARGRALALNQSQFKVSIYPTLLHREGKDTTRLIAARTIAEICRSDYSQVLRKMDTMPDLYVFAPKMDYDCGMRLKDAMRKVRLDHAVVVEPLKTRVYPFGDTLGPIVGFAQDNTGKAGLEQVLDPVLAGIPGRIIVQKDALGNHYRYPDFPETPPVPGADIALTIDVDFQRIAYEEIAMCVDSFRADAGSVIVLDCRTGEIKAMTDFPYRDPRRTWSRNDTPSYFCKAAEVSFEPGSVFKPVLGLAALESPDAEKIRRSFFDASAGMIEIGGWTIKDVHNCGVQDFPGIFIRSSNIGLSLLSRMVDHSCYFQTMRKLGFGQLTGIELPKEDSGYLDPGYRLAPDKLADVRVANNAFGQGLQTSLLQLAGAYAAIANDGLVKRPFMVKQIQLRDSVHYQAEALTVRRAVSVSAAREMKAILRRVVTEGTGTAANSPFFAAAGKTGTAQKPLPTGGYSKDQSIATFVGFFPVEDPHYVVAVCVDNPRIGRFAGTIACPTFRRIAERCYWFSESDQTRSVYPQITQIPQIPSGNLRNLRNLRIRTNE